ncbi:uncharacterized protein [Miscanthus floridulus]|uniref:uncharacterized protein n=1 Tax=Miscanthus floridulus TaxID=154761 RepID=UPI003459641C
MPGQGIDAILGMNWLWVYEVVLDMKRRSVELRLPSSEERMSLIVPLNQVLLIAAHAEASPGLTSIPVVCEFSDVFPEDLPRLPPDREVEFSIELEPGTACISICPYRMALRELAEMKKQLEELMDKVKNKYPLPRIDTLFDQLAGAKVFSKIDL